MTLQSFPGVPRSVLLTLLMSLAVAGQAAAQETPAPEETPAAQTDTAAEGEATEPAANATSQNDNAPPPMPGEAPVVTRSDGEILQALKVLSEAEVAQAELALEESSSQQVKDAAQQILAEHSDTLEQIDTLATRVGVSLTESQLSAALLERSEATTEELEGLSGSEFECTWLQKEAEDHQFALTTVDRELLPFAKSFSVRNFLSEAAPAFEEQAVAVREMHANLDTCG